MARKKRLKTLKSFLREISQEDFDYIRSCFYHRRAVDYFVLLGNNKEKPFSTINESARKSGLTFSHGIKLINEWKEIGLLEKIRKKPNSRSIKIVLTQKGQRIREHLVKIQIEVNDAERNFPMLLRKARESRGIMLKKETKRKIKELEGQLQEAKSRLE